MRTYQDIEKDIQIVTEQTAQLAFMNKEQIYTVVAMLISLSDELNNFMHELDINIAKTEEKIHSEIANSDKKLSASMISVMVKGATAAFKADKEWAERQVNLLRDLRIAALAAQRSAEN